MKWERIGEGFVSRRQPGTPTAIAGGPRCAIADGGDIVCSFAVSSSLGVNDFVPTLSRSRDGGETWIEEAPIWPELAERASLFVSVSRSPGGELFLYGASTPIDTPGETFWSDETQGMKQNGLVWARSRDGGQSWSAPRQIPMPLAGSAEAPGPMCVTREGRWLACFAPYNTFDPKLRVDRNQIVVVRSDDQGATWEHTAMLRFADVDSGGAEAWVVELADGRLLGTSWNVSLVDGRDHPNAYAVSSDSGETWSPTKTTGINGQTTALAALPDGGALFLCCQRKGDEAGIALAQVRPTETDFGVESMETIWEPQRVTQSAKTADHSEWQDFAFGEPAVAILRDGTLRVVFWCVQPNGQGVRYIKLRNT